MQELIELEMIEQEVGPRLVARPLTMSVGNHKEEETNLHIVRKSVASVGVAAVREGSTGRVVAMPRPEQRMRLVVPRIWAVGETVAAESVVETHVSEARHGAPAPVRSTAAPMPEVAFYRKYTEALLRRYLRMSTEAGRVPSMLGRELFRGHVTSYKVKSFEDVVIFCYDVEKCLQCLNAQEQALIKRIALQCYSQGEAAAILGLSLRTCVRMYAQTLDKLTRVLLEKGLLNPLG